METCKRNYNVVNSFFQFTYHLNESNLRDNFEIIFNSDRNFMNVSITTTQISFHKISQFLLKFGDSVRSLDIQLLTSENQVLDQIINLCPLREKLRVGFYGNLVNSRALADPNNAMDNLTELTLDYSLFYCDTYVDLNLFTKSKLEKLTLKRLKLKNSATDEEISNSKWNLKELTVKYCHMTGNFDGVVKLLKLQKNLRCVYFQLSDYRYKNFNNEFKDLVDFLLNLSALKRLNFKFPKNSQQLIPADFINTSIEVLEIKSHQLTREEKLEIKKCFPNLKRPITYYLSRHLY